MKSRTDWARRSDRPWLYSSEPRLSVWPTTSMALISWYRSRSLIRSVRACSLAALSVSASKSNRASAPMFAVVMIGSFGAGGGLRSGLRLRLDHLGDRLDALAGVDLVVLGPATEAQALVQAGADRDAVVLHVRVLGGLGDLDGPVERLDGVDEGAGEGESDESAEATDLQGHGFWLRLWAVWRWTKRTVGTGGGRCVSGRPGRHAPGARRARAFARAGPDDRTPGTGGCPSGADSGVGSRLLFFGLYSGPPVDCKAGAPLRSGEKNNAASDASPCRTRRV